MLKNREGFTLIELLIVVVIIGILAAIALPKFGATRERAYVSAMQSDLRNLQTQMEMFYADNTGANAYTYNGATVVCDGTGTVDFTCSQGVTVTIGAATDQTWWASATHAALPATVKCAVFVGYDAAAGAAVATPATQPGVVACDTP